MATSIGIGLCGLGLHGTRYARHITHGDLPGTHLAAVWRRDPEKGAAAAAEFGAHYHAELDALIRDERVDAIVAAVPAGHHAYIARRAVEAGKPLLCEKPLGRTREEAEEIAARFDAAGLLLTVAQTLRFDPLVQALAARVPELNGLTGFCLEQRIEPRGLGWEDDPALSGGGVLIQTGIHTLDALRFITRPRAVHVRAASMTRTVFRNVEDQALVLAELEGAEVSKLDRVVGHVASSKVCGSRHMRFAFYGEDGGLEADFIGRTLTRVRGRSQERIDVPEEHTIATVARGFVAALRGEGDNPVPGVEGARVVGDVMAAYEAAGVRFNGPAGATDTTRP